MNENSLNSQMTLLHIVMILNRFLKMYNGFHTQVKNTIESVQKFAGLHISQ